MSVPKRFDVLRFFSGLLKVLAWINLVIAILAAIGIAIAGGQAGAFLSLAGDQYAPLASTVAGASTARRSHSLVRPSTFSADCSARPRSRSSSMSRMCMGRLWRAAA